METIKIGIRGLGLLGTRLAMMIAGQDDLITTFGIIVNDRFSVNTIFALAAWGKDHKVEFWQKLYVDAPEAEVKKLNRNQSLVKFLPIEGLIISDSCDILIDTACSEAQGIGVPVMLQSGAAPQGQLFIPPMERPSGQIFRLGDCLLSGLVPLLWPFRTELSGINITSLTTIASMPSPGGYLLPELVTGVKVNRKVTEALMDNLPQLFNCPVKIGEAYQIAGLEYYTVAMTLSFEQQTKVDDLKNIWQQTPRVWLTPEIPGLIISSTTSLDYFCGRPSRYLQQPLSPIIIYTDLLKQESDTDVKLVIVIRHEVITAMSNLDAARMVIRSMSADDAMERLDRFQTI